MLLINGLADDLSSWELQLPALAAGGFRVLRFDNRGVGRSDQPAGPYTAEMLAEDAKALVVALGVGRVHLGREFYCCGCFCFPFGWFYSGREVGEGSISLFVSI